MPFGYDATLLSLGEWRVLQNRDMPTPWFMDPMGARQWRVVCAAEFPRAPDELDRRQEPLPRIADPFRVAETIDPHPCLHEDALPQRLVGGQPGQSLGHRGWV
jgi:hypothetical protein